jgi:hypothetical protein
MIPIMVIIIAIKKVPNSMISIKQKVNRLSIIEISLENLLRILPSGFLSKNS